MFEKLKKSICSYIAKSKNSRGLWVFAPISYKHPQSYEFGSNNKPHAFFYETTFGFTPVRFIFSDVYGKEIVIKSIRFKRIDLNTTKPTRYFVSNGNIHGFEFKVERNDNND